MENTKKKNGKRNFENPVKKKVKNKDGKPSKYQNEISKPKFPKEYKKRITKRHTTFSK